MSKTLHLFNIIAGIIILSSMIITLVSGSNNLPYAIILIYVLCYWLQKVNYKGITKFIGLIVNILLLIWSLFPLLDFIYPFAP